MLPMQWWTVLVSEVEENAGQRRTIVTSGGQYWPVLWWSLLVSGGQYWTVQWRSLLVRGRQLWPFVDSTGHCSGGYYRPEVDNCDQWWTILASAVEENTS